MGSLRRRDVLEEGLQVAHAAVPLTVFQVREVAIEALGELIETFKITTCSALYELSVIFNHRDHVFKESCMLAVS